MLAKKKFIFVADFDGTLTQQDFYQLLIAKYHKEKGQQLYANWKKGEMTDFVFLNKIFSSVNRTEAELLEDILEIDFDDYVADFIEQFKAWGGEFLILSAGTVYYIEKLLQHKKIQGVQVLSNQGVYQDKGIRLVADEKSLFYSERYGIDKGKVITELKKQYQKVYYAGDSEPDVAAAKLADLVFAKNELPELLKEQEIDFVYFNNFKEIKEYLQKKEAIK